MATDFIWYIQIYVTLPPPLEYVKFLSIFHEINVESGKKVEISSTGSPVPSVSCSLSFWDAPSEFTCFDSTDRGITEHITFFIVNQHVALCLSSGWAKKQPNFLFTCFCNGKKTLEKYISIVNFVELLKEFSLDYCRQWTYEDLSYMNVIAGSGHIWEPISGSFKLTQEHKL